MVKQAFLGRAVGALVGAEQRPRWSLGACVNWRKGAEKRTTPGGDPLGVACQLVGLADSLPITRLPERNPLRNNTLFDENRKCLKI